MITGKKGNIINNLPLLFSVESTINPARLHAFKTGLSGEGSVIYFIERDAAFASHLYSLIEFKRQGNGVRKDASYEKDYLAGLYGAIPYLGAFNLRKKAP